MVTFNTIEFAAGNDGVSLLTLNRPAVMNAYTSHMALEILSALEQFYADDSQRVLILTGRGAGFCSGGDLKDATAREDAERHLLGHGRVLRQGIHRVITYLHEMDKPSIAAVNGAAVAGGLALAAACDFRIAAPTARLGDTAVRYGLLSDEGGAWLVQRLIGVEQAKLMSLTGRVYDAATALRIGLVGSIADDGDAVAAARDLAAELIAISPVAQRLNSTLIDQSATGTLPEALRLAELAVGISNGDDSSRDLVRAFAARS